MHALHIIPAALGYFEDIAAAAFLFAERLQGSGIDVEPFTLQTGQPSRGLRRSVESKTIVSGQGFAYSNTLGFKGLSRALAAADIVHLHAPFLGFGKELLRFKQEYPERPLVITYYGKLEYQDFFSLCIRGYNAWYLPKLMAVTQAVVEPCGGAFKKTLPRQNGDEIVTLTNAVSGVQLRYRQKVQNSFFIHYLELLKQHSYF